MSRPIRVAQIMGKMVGGGLEQVVMNYYRHINRSKVQFDFIIDADSTCVPEREIQSLGGHIIYVPPYQRLLANQHYLVNLFKQENWTIVHSHENALSVFPLHAAKRARVPVRIAHSHSTAGRGEPVRNAVKWFLKRWVSLYATNRMACSRHAGEWLFGKGSDFDLLYNAIDLNEFAFDDNLRREVRKKLGINDTTLVVGHIGRFVTQKNHRFLIDIFKKITEIIQDSVLVLVGEGKLWQEIKQKVREERIEDKVLFLGQQNNTGCLYQAFDVFCFPSLYEGLGMVAVEAQMAGLPCVCSDRVPIEASITGNCRFISLAASANVWAQEIIDSNNSEKSRVILRDSKVESYDIEKMARKLEDYYLNLYSKGAI